MWARIINPCVLTSSQPPPEARLSYCPYGHTNIPPGPTENSWDVSHEPKTRFLPSPGLPRGYLRTQLDSAGPSPALGISFLLPEKGSDMDSVSSYWAVSRGNSPVTSFFYFEVRRKVLMLLTSESAGLGTECCVWMENSGGRTEFEGSPPVCSNVAICRDVYARMFVTRFSQ